MRPEHEGPAYISRVTPSGHRHIQIDYWVKPERTPAWARKMKETMGEQQFNREFRRDWESSPGDPYYPEWQTVPASRRIIPKAGYQKGLPILRFHDFGFHFPAVLWAQYSPSQDRLWVLREFMPRDIDSHSMGMLVLYLSGQLMEETFHAEAPPLARRWLSYLQKEPKYPPPPWFDHQVIPPEFQDFAGPEATQIKNSVTSEDEARTWAEVYGAMGINLQVRMVRHKARELVVRSLMRPRPDGYFGLVVDPSCSIFLAGLNGGIAYKQPTVADPHPDDCVKDGFYEHLHDALGYGVVQVCPPVQMVKPVQKFTRGGPTGRSIIPVEESMGEPLFSEVE
jgi:hypothetical protein